MIEAVAFNDAGLVPVIAQDAASSQVLMVAWMNKAALRETIETGRAVYFSRSRQKLWRKGEESGHVQSVKELRLDCDGDVILMQVEQIGGIACHTGREHCFYRKLDAESGEQQWVSTEPVIKPASEIYKDKSS
jgi:phosphoribosyl-AMP cyclohydrolase